MDCGLVENIPVVHVYPKLLCEEVPQLCIPCQLHGVNPVRAGSRQTQILFIQQIEARLKLVFTDAVL